MWNNFFSNFFLIPMCPDIIVSFSNKNPTKVHITDFPENFTSALKVRKISGYNTH